MIGSPSAGAIAWVNYTGDAVNALVGEADSYNVRAACAVADALTYIVLVDGKKISGGGISCGKEVINSAFERLSGRVQVEFEHELPAGATGFAEIVVAP